MVSMILLKIYFNKAQISNLFSNLIKNKFCNIAETIPDGSEPPRFIECLQDTTIVDGTTAKIECKVKGQPKPDVEW